MNYTPDQLIALQRQSLESMHAVAMASLNGLDKLAQLNLQAAKASLKEGVEQTVNVLESRDVKSLQDTLGDSAQPTADKVQAYTKHVYQITQETSQEISRVIEKQWSDGNRQIYSALDAMAKSAPAGTEGLVSMMKSAVTAANTAWDEVNKASRKVAEMSEQNAQKAVDATRRATSAKN